MGTDLFKCKEPMVRDGGTPGAENDVYCTRVPMVPIESRDAPLPGLRSNPELAVHPIPPANRGKRY